MNVVDVCRGFPHIWWVIKADLHARRFSCIDRMSVNTYIQVCKNRQSPRCKQRTLFRARNEVFALAGPVRYERKLHAAPGDTPEHLVRSQSGCDNQRFCAEVGSAGYDTQRVRPLLDSNDFYILHYVHLSLL